MSNFIDNDISLFINNKNKDKFFKDFNDNLKDKKRDFNDNIKIKRNSNENFNKNNNENDYDFNNFCNLFNVIFENDNVKNNKIIDFLSDFNDTRD